MKTAGFYMALHLQMRGTIGAFAYLEGLISIQTFLVSMLKVKERDLPDEGVEQELVVLLSLVAGGGVYQLYKSIIAEVE